MSEFKINRLEVNGPAQLGDHNRMTVGSTGEVAAEIEKLEALMREACQKVGSRPEADAMAAKTKEFAAEARSQAPRSDVLRVTGQGLIDAAKACAGLAAPIAAAVKTILMAFP